MRLINARTFELEEVLSEWIHPYAIVSHRWGDGEISFQELQNRAVAFASDRFAKIRKVCEQAVRDHLGYVWLDTCCINKDSSAELSEAINSMYKWYQAAAVCYAFLSDVNARPLDREVIIRELRGSVWFTRGWTLQELLAPSNLVFYNSRWQSLGTKGSWSEALATITGIDEAILNGESLSKCSIAQRMFWASRRVTTRVEDTAYCLLGIFDVNMPMLYGEGDKAFFRLQEQIIRQSDDHTIFSWSIQSDNQPGLLADHPSAFSECRCIRASTSRKGHSSYTMTNRGLSIKLLATPYAAETYLVRLDCGPVGMPGGNAAANKFRLGMFLRRLDEDDQFARVKLEGRTIVSPEEGVWNQDTKLFGDSKDIRHVREVEFNVRQQLIDSRDDFNRDMVYGFHIATEDIFRHSPTGKDQIKISAEVWDQNNRIMSIKPGDCGTVGYLDISQQNCEIQIIKLGFDFEFNPVCFVATGYGNKSSKALISKESTGWTTQEDFQLRGIHDRSPFDPEGWSKVGSYTTAYDMERHPGLWALKGDRLNGLFLRLLLRGGVRGPDIHVATVTIIRGTSDGKPIWEVYLDDFGNNSQRAI